MNAKQKAMARQWLRAVGMPDNEIENEIKNSTLKDIVQFVFYIRLGAAFLVGIRYITALDDKRRKNDHKNKRT